jgi:hypothetical protein
MTALLVGCADLEDGDRDGFSRHQNDCDDANPAVNPDAAEVPGNAVDENCNGDADGDLDGDGFSNDGTFGGKPDCDDHSSSRYPGAPEVVDEVSQDCDAQADNHLPTFDDDMDGFSEAQGDCNDGNPNVFPAADEVMNAVDDNCNGLVDEDSKNFDDDHDGLSEAEGDCNDQDPSVYPGAPETGFKSGFGGDGIDNNCDGLVDEGTTAFDDDGDGYSEDGSADKAPDCDDADPTVYPGAVENYSDGIDSNCNGWIETSPSDGPKPVGFTDVLVPLKAVNFSEDVDAPQCWDAGNLSALTPFSPPRIYPVRFIDIKDSVGQPKYNGRELAEQLVSHANSYFADAGIRFIVADYVEQSHDTYTNMEHSALAPGMYDAICEYECGGCPNGYACNAPDGRIVVLLVNSLELDGVAVAGVATLPNNPMAGIALERSSDDVRHGHAFVHQLGHYFGINHTHRHTEDSLDPDGELVDRKDQNQCHTRGDRFCDTPADPGPRACGTTAACQPDCNGETDKTGAKWQPDTKNIMSSYGCSEGAHFSAEQLSLAICAAAFSMNRAALEPYNSNCLAKCCDKQTFVVSGAQTPTECREKGASVCLDHFGAEHIIAQGSFEYLASPMLPCTALCADNTSVLLDDEYACLEGCVKDAKNVCDNNGGTIRVKLGVQRVWCKDMAACQ